MAASSPRRLRRLVTAALALVLATGLVGTLAACDAADDAPPATAVATRLPPAPPPTAEPAAPDEPLVTSTPDEHSEVGSLVPGFPADLLPLPQDAVLLVTSAVPVGDSGAQEVSLNVRTGLSTEEVLDLYRTALTGAGFSEVAITGSGLTAETSFSRSGGDELVSLGVLDDGDHRTVTIGGRVREGAAP